MSERTMSRELEDLILDLKGLVHVRALLEARGATNQELDAHTEGIVRVRARLAELVEDSQASYGAAA